MLTDIKEQAHSGIPLSNDSLSIAVKVLGKILIYDLGRKRCY